MTKRQRLRVVLVAVTILAVLLQSVTAAGNPRDKQRSRRGKRHHETPAHTTTKAVDKGTEVQHTPTTLVLQEHDRHRHKSTLHALKALARSSNANTAPGSNDADSSSPPVINGTEPNPASGGTGVTQPVKQASGDESQDQGSNGQASVASEPADPTITISLKSSNANPRYAKAGDVLTVVDSQGKPVNAEILRNSTNKLVGASPYIVTNTTPRAYMFGMATINGKPSETKRDPTNMVFVLPELVPSHQALLTDNDENPRQARVWKKDTITFDFRFKTSVSGCYLTIAGIEVSVVAFKKRNEYTGRLEVSATTPIGEQTAKLSNCTDKAGNVMKPIESKSAVIVISADAPQPPTMRLTSTNDNPKFATTSNRLRLTVQFSLPPPQGSKVTATISGKSATLQNSTHPGFVFERSVDIIDDKDGALVEYVVSLTTADKTLRWNGTSTVVFDLYPLQLSNVQWASQNKICFTANKPAIKLCEVKGTHGKGTPRVPTKQGDTFYLATPHTHGTHILCEDNGGQVTDWLQVSEDPLNGNSEPGGDSGSSSSSSSSSGATTDSSSDSGSSDDSPPAVTFTTRKGLTLEGESAVFSVTTTVALDETQSTAFARLTDTETVQYRMAVTCSADPLECTGNADTSKWESGRYTVEFKPVSKAGSTGDSKFVDGEISVQHAPGGSEQPKADSKSSEESSTHDSGEEGPTKNPSGRDPHDDTPVQYEEPESGSGGWAMLGVLLLLGIGVAALYFMQQQRLRPQPSGRFVPLDQDDVEMTGLAGGTSAALAQREFPSVTSPPRASRSGDSEESSAAAEDESKHGSVLKLMRRVLAKLGIPEYGMKRYTQVLEEKYIMRTEQLRGLDPNDWKRLGLPEIIENALRKELDSTAGSARSKAKGLSLKPAKRGRSEKAPNILAIPIDSPTEDPIDLDLALDMGSEDPSQSSATSSSKKSKKSKRTKAKAKDPKKKKKTVSVAALPEEGNDDDDAWPSLDLGETEHQQPAEEDNSNIDLTQWGLDDLDM